MLDQVDKQTSRLPREHVTRYRSNIDIRDEGPINDNFEEESRLLANDIAYLLQGYEDIRFQIDIQANSLQKFYQSTNLNEISISQSMMLVNIEVFNKHNYKTRVHETIGGISKSDISWEELENHVNDLLYKIKNLVTAKYPNPGKYPVVLSQDATFSLIHETIGHACEGDQIITNNSYLSGLKGYKVASPELTLIDDPHIRAVGWAEYDDEGSKTQGTIIVDEGILSNYLHSKKTAKYLQETTTGNARASSYIAPPESRQTNLFLEPKDNSSEELIEEVRDGLFIGPTESASTSIYTGDFSIESQYCYKIQDGELGEILGSVTITGTSLKTLNNIISIGRDTKIIPAICLKNESKLLVGGICPEINLSEIYIR